MTHTLPSSRTPNAGPAAVCPERGVEPLLQRLRRPIVDSHGAPRPFAGLVAALLTFGAWPAIVWPVRFFFFSLAQQHELRDLAAKLWQHRPSPAAKKLWRAADSIALRGWLAAAPALIALAAVLKAATSGAGGSHHPASLGILLHNTYLFAFRHGYIGPLAPNHPYVAWCIGLSIAYLCQCLVVALHVRDLRRFVRAFNGVAASHHVRGVQWPASEWSTTHGAPNLLPVLLIIFVGPAWLFAGIVLSLMCKAHWGWALALAGAAQSRYMLETCVAVRAHLAERGGKILLGRSKAVQAAVHAGHGLRRCRRERCRAPLALTAIFCPRCGISTSPCDAAHADFRCARGRLARVAAYR